ncbi:MAG: oligosaccharide flippase family protein [Pseudomonadota bacterium]
MADANPNPTTFRRPIYRRSADAAKGPALVFNQIRASLNNLIGSEHSLRHRVLRGGSITLVGFGAGQAIRLASNLIMTRLLTADAFGLMAITISFQVLMVMISDVGINASIVRSQSANDARFLSTAWVTQIIRGILISIIVLIGAGIVFILSKHQTFPPQSVFNDPRLPLFLIIIAISSLIDGLRSVHMVLAQRALKMERVVMLEISAQIGAVAFMISSFFLGADAFSLVIGALAAVIISVAGSHFLFDGPTLKLRVNRADFDEIFSFGKWLIVASIAGFITQRGDQLIFGSLMAKEKFGVYSIATIWITLVIVLFDMIQNRITYPAFSEVWRERKKDMTQLYYRFRMLADCACVVSFLSIILFAETVFKILYTEPYTGVVDYLKFLAIIILLLPYRLLTSILLADGKSRQFMIITLVPALMMLLTPWIYATAGLNAAIIYVATIQLPTLPLSWFFVRQHIQLNIARELVLLAFTVVAIAFLANQGSPGS